MLDIYQILIYIWVYNISSIYGRREEMLIGIVGFIGSGKGTVGDVLVKDYDFEKDSFANPLKDAVSIIFGWDRKLLEGDIDESREFREKIDPFWTEVCGFDLTPRYALQLFGTECIRQVFNPEVWSASLIQRYEKSNLNTVVTDCRFKNEINAIQRAGGQVWRVRRGEEPEWYDHYWNLLEREATDEIERLRGIDFPHVSETDWIGSNFDIIIENDGSLNDLKYKVDMIMQEKANNTLDYFGG
jgi:hypothetical protein